jgi:hypothetical protein
MVSEFPPLSDFSSTPVALVNPDGTNCTYYQPYSWEKDNPDFFNLNTTVWNFNLPSATWTFLDVQLFITRNDFGAQAIPEITSSPCSPSYP